ncbi:peptidoglycan-binding protein [uncultured Massilia sp.]|uniref:peptidoglycan-binding protein n=1 Tax=uncultured Massilia sp. TaxID=169973 RepID=UPI0025EC3168|nr:peptidoglycan-binding protein [uncultured Massilia sp.]
MGDGPSVVMPCPLADLRCLEALVIDAADQPVADVLLALRKDGQETTARTDSRGLVRFEGLEDGSYTLLAPEWDASACAAGGTRALPSARLESTRPPPPWQPVATAAAPADHLVADGERLEALALRFGYAPAALWDFAGNASLKEGRGGMYVRAGDTLRFPPRAPDVIETGTGRFHYLRVLTTPSAFRLRFVYEDGRPRAEERWIALVLLANGDTAGLAEGRTDADGVLETLLATDATEIEVTIGAGADQEVYRLHLGAYEPPDRARGIQTRLGALGYYVGALDDEAGPMTAEAIAAFQEDFGLPITGTADDATVDKLHQVFGS